LDLQGLVANAIAEKSTFDPDEATTSPSEDDRAFSFPIFSDLV